MGEPLIALVEGPRGYIRRLPTGDLLDDVETLTDDNRAACMFTIGDARAISDFYHGCDDWECSRMAEVLRLAKENTDNATLVLYFVDTEGPVNE